MAICGVDPKVVHHAADQEQAPTARRLQSLQLGVEVGGLRVGNLPPAALVDDA